MRDSEVRGSGAASQETAPDRESLVGEAWQGER